MLKQLAGVPPSVSITDQIVEAAKTVAGTAKSAADAAKAAAAQANGDSEKEKMAQEAEKAAQVSSLKLLSVASQLAYQDAATIKADELFAKINGVKPD